MRIFLALLCNALFVSYSISLQYSLSDKSLKELALKVLELASLYSTVVRFIEQKNGFRYGRVNNALAAAMDEYIIDYLVHLGN